FAFPSAPRQILDAAADRVVERSPAATVDVALERDAQDVAIACKRRARRQHWCHILVERDGKDLVQWMTRLREGRRAGDGECPMLVHAAAAVDQQTNRR